jgi:hypothetical protein
VLTLEGTQILRLALLALGILARRGPRCIWTS